MTEKLIPEVIMDKTAGTIEYIMTDEPVVYFRMDNTLEIIRSIRNKAIVGVRLSASVEHAEPVAAEEQTGKAGDGGDDAMDALDMLKWFRKRGWMVAVHNDYRQHNRLQTFWLLTHSDGRWVKGEGVSDALALAEAMDSLAALGVQS